MKTKKEVLKKKAEVSAVPETPAPGRENPYRVALEQIIRTAESGTWHQKNVQEIVLIAKQALN